MSSNTPVAGLPYILLSDAPNANTLAQGLATALDHVVIPKYATTTARDAANTAPVEGDECYVSAAGVTKGYYCYSGSAWIGPTLLNQAWISYTPTWSTSTGLHIPTIGNGTFTFKYSRIGSLCFVNFLFVPGTTTNYNSGTAADNFLFGLPFASVATATVGSAVAQNSASTNWLCTPLVTAGSSSFQLLNSGQGVSSAGATTNGTNGGVIDCLTPFTWTSATTNSLKGQFFYEV